MEIADCGLGLAPDPRELIQYENRLGFRLVIRSQTPENPEGQGTIHKGRPQNFRYF